jgi:adenylate kinase
LSRLALVLFGSPGSGKGTLSKYLTGWLGVPQISTGDMLRENIKAGTALGASVSGRMKAGSLVSDEVVNRLVEDRISQPDASKGFILDGYPRTVDQADELMRFAGPGARHALTGQSAEVVVIHLVVDYNVIISRLTGRRVCPKCGTLYNAISRPPKTPGICDLDGTPLEVRDDDREEVVRARLEEYESRTMPLIEFFRSRGTKLFDVDAGVETPEEVFRSVEARLNSVFEMEEQLAPEGMGGVGR